MINNFYLKILLRGLLIWISPSSMNFINKGVTKDCNNIYYTSGGDRVGSLGAVDATTNLDVPPAVIFAFISGNVACLP